MDIWSLAIHLITAVTDALPFILAEIRRHLRAEALFDL